MTTKFKDALKRGAGRPANSTMTERQAIIKRELIATLKPYYKPAAEELARIAGIDVDKINNKDKSVSELIMEDVDKNKDSGNGISPTIRVQACRALMDGFTDAIKDLYSKEDYTPAKVSPEDEKPKLSSVSKFSLHVRSTEE